MLTFKDALISFYDENNVYNIIKYQTRHDLNKFLQLCYPVFTASTKRNKKTTSMDIFNNQPLTSLQSFSKCGEVARFTVYLKFRDF